jgi:hypothetical protein
MKAPCDPPVLFVTLLGISFFLLFVAFNGVQVCLLLGPCFLNLHYWLAHCCGCHAGACDIIG